MGMSVNYELIGTQKTPRKRKGRRELQRLHIPSPDAAQRNPGWVGRSFFDIFFSVSLARNSDSWSEQRKPRIPFHSIRATGLEAAIWLRMCDFVNSLRSLRSGFLIPA
jgi:hypothetical protein